MDQPIKRNTSTLLLSGIILLVMLILASVGVGIYFAMSKTSNTNVTPNPTSTPGSTSTSGPTSTSKPKIDPEPAPQPSVASDCEVFNCTAHNLAEWNTLCPGDIGCCHTLEDKKRCNTDTWEELAKANYKADIPPVVTTASESPPPPPADDYKQLHSLQNKNLCLTATGSGTANNTNIEIGPCYNTAAQLFKYEPSTGFIRYKRDPTKCVHIYGSDTITNNQNVSLWECIPNHSRFKWIKEGNMLKSAAGSNKCMHVYGAQQIASGQNVSTWTCDPRNNRFNWDF